MNQNWLVTAFFFAISQFGTLGIILGPVLFALLRALLELYMEEYGNA